jgi:acetyl-CoA acetyltransferase family protein
MKEVYIVDYIRTPFSRARPRNPERDVFSEIPGARLVAETLNNMIDVRLKGIVTRDEVDQVMMGLCNNFGDNFSISGRIADFYAKFPNKTPAISIDQQCGSGMSAIQHGFMSIKLGYEDIIIATSFEHQTREPMHDNPHIKIDSAIADPKSRWYNPDFDLACSLSMIQTAQKLYEMRIDEFGKQDLDEYAVRSHNLAEKYWKSGYFKDEIVPILGHVEGDINQELLVDHDLSIRERANLKETQNIRVVSKPGWAGGYLHPLLDQATYKQKNGGSSEGVITPGNSSPLNAGAATVMLMSKEKMEEKGLTPLAKIVEIGWAGVDPSVMGRGPVPATKFALKKANMRVDDIDYWEINEAFTIVALNAIHELSIKDHNKTVNIRGGSTAIGHPIAATGIRLTGTLARILKEEKAKIGCSTMCCGGGQGTTIIIENPEV